MAFFGVDYQVRIEEMNLQFKNILRSRSVTSFMKLKAVFTKYDVNQNGKLDIREFENALQAFG
jgi:Ca2+-binding EF-hand superfamily protein